MPLITNHVFDGHNCPEQATHLGRIFAVFLFQLPGFFLGFFFKYFYVNVECSVFLNFIQVIMYQVYQGSFPALNGVLNLGKR